MALNPKPARGDLKAKSPVFRPSSMLVPRRLLALLAALILGCPTGAGAMDDFVRASSSGPTLLRLCGKDGPASEATCKAQPYDALAGRMEDALKAALAKAPATTRPLLKRDQAWFNEMLANIA